MDASQGTYDEAESRSKQSSPVIDVDVDDNNEKTEPKKGGTSGRKVSFVWQRFLELSGRDDVECKYCKKKMQGNSKRNGTSAMSKHLQNICRPSPLYKQKGANPKKQSTLSFKKPAESGDSALEAHSFS